MWWWWWVWCRGLTKILDVMGYKSTSSTFLEEPKQLTTFDICRGLLKCGVPIMLPKGSAHTTWSATDEPLSAFWVVYQKRFQPFYVKGRKRNLFFFARFPKPLYYYATCGSVTGNGVVLCDDYSLSRFMALCDPWSSTMQRWVCLFSTYSHRVTTKCICNDR